MKETCCHFGPDRRLPGILSLPAVLDPALPAFLLLNAGLLHKVGPYRMNVALARRLATLGFACLRFDKQGIGDGELGSEGKSDKERGLADVIDAIDYALTQGLGKTVVLLGLCAGADSSYEVAIRDPRVAGIVLLDGFGYITPGYLARQYASRLQRPTAVAQGVARRVRAAVPQLLSGAPERSPRPPAEPTAGEYRDFPAPKVAARELNRLAERGCECLFVYTPDSGYFNHEEQFWRMLPGVRKCAALQVAYQADADHTFTLLEARERMFADILTWVRLKFPTNGPQIALGTAGDL